jgi:putative ABC transport system permease protein
MLLFTLAWRNVWRYGRRTGLTIGAIALGLAFNIFMRGIGDGFHEQMVDNSVRSQIGHLEIHRTGYHNNPGINKYLPDPAEIERKIRRLGSLRGFSFRVLGDGLASTAEDSAGVSIIGVDPVQEKTVTVIYRAIVKGKYLEPSATRPILIGDRLARSLSASLDNKIVLMVQAADGSMGAQLFRVEGIFHSGSPELDRGVVYILRRDAQDLFALDNHVTEAVVLLRSSDQVQAARAALDASLKGLDVEVLTWDQVEPFLKQFIELDDAFFYIMVAILFAVISIGILNTIMMSVFERVREFGVMMALGTKPRQVVGLVVQEACVLALVGIAIGATLGSGVTLYFASAGIDLSAFAEGAATFGITTTVIYTKLLAGNVFSMTLAVLLVVLVVAVYPAVRASRLKPVDAIRHV